MRLEAARVKTEVYGAMTDRLSRADWLKAGLQALARDGAASLKADVLAKRLGVSRGSFYWHFADIDAFHDALAAAWRDVAVEQVIRMLEQAAPRMRMRRLLGVALGADPSLEIGMRAWAASSPRAQEAVTAVDARRLAYMERMLTAVGVAPEASGVRARVIYWAYLGSVLSRVRVEDLMLARLIDELADFATRDERL